MTSPNGPIVVAVHADRGGRVVGFGALLARTLDRALVLVTAYEHLPGTPGDPRQLTSNARRYAAAEAELAAIDVARDASPEIERRVVPTVDVDRAIADTAAELEAVVIVTGADEKRHVARDLIGAAPCPVAVVPPDSTLDPFAVIGVAFDGSPASRLAAAAALSLAAHTAARVELIGVAAPTGPTRGDPLAIAGTADASAIELEREAHTFRMADESGVRIGSRVLRGKTADELVTATRDLDLIACGSRGRGTIGRLFLGSTSTALISDAHCPVLVVPPGVRLRPGRPLGLSTARSGD